MKLLLLTLTLCGFAARPAAAQDKPAKPSLKALEEKYGFRDARLEADTTALAGLELTDVTQNVREYARPADAKSIGAAQLEAIRYLFYKGHLATIALTTEGASNSQALLAALRAQYGAGDKTNPYRQHYVWSTKSVLMTFDQNSAVGDGKVTITSKVVQQAQQADEATAARQAISDL